MDKRDLFMIIGNDVKVLQNTDMDHREWYLSLGLDPNQFDNIVRGYIVDSKIVFFKGSDFRYDEEVIKAACMYTPTIRSIVCHLSFKAYCGIMIPPGGGKWEPIIEIQEKDITGIPISNVPASEQKKFVPLDNKPILEFQNQYEDDAFVQKAIMVTFVVLVLAVISKIVLFRQGKILQLGNFLDILLSLAQIGSLLLTIRAYRKKQFIVRYLGVLASALLVFTLDIFDVMLGIFYLVFHINHKYFNQLFQIVKQTVEHLKTRKKS